MLCVDALIIYVFLYLFMYVFIDLFKWWLWQYHLDYISKKYNISMVTTSCVSPLPDLIVRVIQENKGRMKLEEWRKVGVLW